MIAALFPAARRARAVNLESRSPAIHNWGTGDCFREGARSACAPTDQSMNAREMDLRHGFSRERSRPSSPRKTPWASHSLKKSSHGAERHLTAHSASATRRAACSASFSRPGLALTNAAPFQRGGMRQNRVHGQPSSQGIAADMGGACPARRFQSKARGPFREGF